MNHEAKGRRVWEAPSPPLLEHKDDSQSVASVVFTISNLREE